MKSTVDTFQGLFRMDPHGKEKKMVTLKIPETVGENYVLVKMAYAPINPSDWMFFLKNTYGHPDKFTKEKVNPGFEGSGTVVKIGPNVSAELMGSKVAIFLNPYAPDFNGTWTEYIVVNKDQVIPFPNEANLDDIHSPFINPATVFTMAEISKESSYKSVIFNAAGSSLCRMAAKLFQKVGIQTIMIVRRDSHIPELMEKGATIVLNCKSENYLADLEKVIADLQPLGLFDAVGGPDSMEVFKRMPAFSTLYCYGALSRKAFDGLSPLDLIFQQKTMRYVIVYLYFSLIILFDDYQKFLIIN